MGKKILRLRKATRQHLFSNIYEDCPPESPYQLYVNAALDALGEQYGDIMNDLSQEVTQIVINAAVTAASAALTAARVSDDWRDFVKPARQTKWRWRKARGK